MNKNLKTAKKLLMVVDLINGFVKKGNMADTYIQHIIPESRRLVECFLQNCDPVMYIKDYHKTDCQEFKSFPAHCEQGSYEAQMADELLPFENEAIVIHKNATSAIFAEKFIEVLEQAEMLEEVVVIGCCTDICVLNLAIPLKNYFDEKNRDVRIIVPKNAVETFEGPTHPRDEYNEIAFKLLAQSGINLVNNY